jgi:hypothetical protein
MKSAANRQVQQPPVVELTPAERAAIVRMWTAIFVAELRRSAQAPLEHNAKGAAR